MERICTLISGRKVFRCNGLLVMECLRQIIQSAFDDAVAKEYKSRHVSGYAGWSEARYAAIWDNSGDAIARHGLTSAAFQKEHNTHIGEGYNIVLVNGYGVDNVDYYAAIWEKYGTLLLSTRHGIDSSVYQGEFTENYYQGYVLKVVSGYTVGGSDRYAAIWENNVMSAADFEIISNDIKGYLDKHVFPDFRSLLPKVSDLYLLKLRGCGRGYWMPSQSKPSLPHHEL